MISSSLSWISCCLLDLIIILEKLNTDDGKFRKEIALRDWRDEFLIWRESEYECLELFHLGSQKEWDNVVSYESRIFHLQWRQRRNF